MPHRLVFSFEITGDNGISILGSRRGARACTLVSLRSFHALSTVIFYRDRNFSGARSAGRILSRKIWAIYFDNAFSCALLRVIIWGHQFLGNVD